MDITALLDSLASSKLDVPSEIAVLELRRSSVDDLQRRLRKFLKASADACSRDFDRGQWTTHDDRTVVRLPLGAMAVSYHASGAVKFSSGLAPLEGLFTEPETKARLTEWTEAHLRSLGVADTLGRSDSLVFERLWQVKAAGADRAGKTTAPVLCRAVGAFRHRIDGIPVLGPASVAIHVAGGGQLDGVSMLLRGPVSEVLEKARVIHPERAVRQIGQQVAERFAAAKGSVLVSAPQGLQFGYLSLPKRKAQRVLAPAYIAAIDVQHELERQAFVVAMPASERTYLAFDAPGLDNPVTTVGKLTTRRCC